MANKLISQENSILFEKSRLSQGQTSAADCSNNITQKERIPVVAANTSLNTDPRSGSIIKLDKNNLKIKYVTE